MAILKNDDLSFEFNYTGFECGWVQYQFYFRWKGESVIRHDLLKDWSEYWASRPTGAFLANEHRQDTLIPFLKNVLEKDEPDYWEPLEPDIIVAVYPGMYFPFLPSHMKLIYERDEIKAKRIAREQEKAKKGKLPDDAFTFIAFVDAYNLKDARAYQGQGLSWQMIVHRNALEQFVADLEEEYRVFKESFGVDQYDEDE